MEIFPSVKYINPNYISGIIELISDANGPIMSLTLAVTPFITWPLYASILIGEP